MFTLWKPFKEIIYGGENELELLPENERSQNIMTWMEQLHRLLPSSILRIFKFHQPHLLPIIFITKPNAFALNEWSPYGGAPMERTRKWLGKTELHLSTLSFCNEDVKKSATEWELREVVMQRDVM